MSFVHRAAFCVGLASAVASACTTFGVDDPPEGDAAVPTEAAPPSSPEAAVPDAAGPDAPPSPPDAGQCQRTRKGTTTPCTNCVKTPFYLPPPPSDGGPSGPHIFGVTTDATHVFWLEQFGGVSYDGIGNRTVVRRQALTTPSNPETIASINEPLTRLAVVDKTLWVASGSRPAKVYSFDKGCVGAACTSPTYAAIDRASAMIPYRGGVAIAANGHVLTYEAPGDPPSDATIGRGVVGMTEWQSRIAIAADNNPASAASIGFTTGGPELALLPLSPNLPRYPSVGANMLASTCEDLWAYQIFRPLDGGAEHTALVHVNAPGNARGVAVDLLTFAIGADATHVYAGLPNGNGLRRVAKGTAVLETIADNVSVFSFAVTDDTIVFDDHGLGGGKQSVGIFTIKKSN